MPARAKLNLDLQVTGKRPDGMHELRTVMQAIELHDLLVVEATEETMLSVTGFELPAGDANTVIAAHAEVESAAGRSLPASYHLYKRIPPGSGLGGASSDAAAAMRALVSLHGLDLDLKPLAARIGADVTFFLTGGSALVEGMGERVTPIEGSAVSWFAVAWPGIELSTAAVYEAWDRMGASGRKGPNDLREAAAQVEPSLDRFAEHLGDGWQLTGSGSAFFLPCPDREAASAAVEKLDCWKAVTSAVGRWA